MTSRPDLPASVSPTSLSPTPPIQPVLPDFTSLPLWQRRYLAAIQAGVSNDEALKRCGATYDGQHRALCPALVLRYLNESPAFARAHFLISQGVAIMGSATAREIALSQVSALTAHFAEKAMDDYVSVREQVAAGRFVSDLAGLTGQPSTVNISNVTNQAASIVQELRKRQRPDAGRPKRVVEGEQVPPVQES